MIITLTGNLLAERTFEFASWQPGRTQRATAESFQVGGKGINVSRMLTRLGARTVAACFAGGATGDECLQWLCARGLPHHAFRTATPTRTGTVVRVTAPDAANAHGGGADVREGVAGAHAGGVGDAQPPQPPQPETTFLGIDAAPDAAALAECAAWLDAQPVSHALAICGSFPGFLTHAAEPLRDAIVRRIAHGNVHADSHGPTLAWLVMHPVELVKINRQEFDGLCASFAVADADANAKDPGIFRDLPPPSASPMPACLAAACRRWPVRRWVITDGPGPVWFVTRDKAPPASLRPPAIREVSATGSGDVFFAVTLHNFINRHFVLAEAVASAIPCASSNASTFGIAEINTH
jgi:fructose-1-phosphate kinase PfkB-like protein